MISTRGKTAQNPITPSALNQLLKKHLAESFNSFWISGEVFELYQSNAGHSYFTLKDQNATIKCVMFKQTASIKLTKGTQITLLGQISLYVPKGDIQINALKIIESGEGDLSQQFELLKQKLMNLGLFENKRKKPIPKMINSLGIITSPSGAALQDVLNVLLNKNPLIEITVYPTLVQGNDAPPQINHALRSADDNRHDLLLLTRGGGSNNDLWAFNDEMLAHQLTQLNTPVISAVGHETDESISDLVADLSCITPTAAANLISGDFNQLQQNLIHNSRLLALLIQDKFRVFQQKLDATNHQLDKSHPKNTLNQQQHALNNLKQNLSKTFNNYWQRKKTQQQQLSSEFIKKKPNTSPAKLLLTQATQQLNWQIHHQIDTAKQKLGLKANDLNHQNPLAVLNRGYSITTKLSDGSIISDINQVKVGDKVSSQLKSGKILAKIFERLEE